MHLITFIQSTDDWSDLWIRKALILELMLLAISYPLCFLCIYLLFFTKQYHPNLGILMKQTFLQYPIQMSARVLIIAKMMLEDGETLRKDGLFMVASCFRTCLIFIAFYFSFFAMIERTFATIYLKDYENNQRKSIGYFLSFFLHLVSYISAYFFLFEVTPLWPIVSSFLFVNILAFFICIILTRQNQRKYSKILATARYNLSERYQLAENLAVNTLFKKGILLFVFFSILCCSFMSAEEIDEDVYLRNWLHVSFNLSAAAYGLLVPFALFHYNEEWRIAVKKLLARFQTASVEPEIAEVRTDAVAEAVSFLEEMRSSSGKSDGIIFQSIGEGLEYDLKNCHNSFGFTGLLKK